jgi:hypothetical protein
MQLERLALEKCCASAEHNEYVTAFLEKPTPDFSKLSM